MKQIIISCFVGILIGAFLVFKLKKPEIKKEEVVVEKEKVVTKEKVITITREIKNPDGSNITEVVKIEDKKEKKDIETKQKNLDLSIKKDYIIEYNRGFNNTNDFGIKKRLIGDIYVGVGYNEKTGASIGIAILF